MVTPLEKAECLSCFVEAKPYVQTQQRYRTKYGKDPPSCSMAHVIYETGLVLGRARTSTENIASVRQAFSRSPMKSIRTAAREFKLPPLTVLKVLHKKLRLHAYKVQMF